MTTRGLAGTSINTQFLNTQTIVATESAVLENGVFTGTADFGNVSSFIGYSPFPTGSTVGGQQPIFSAVVNTPDLYDYRFRGVESTASVIAATSGASVDLALGNVTPNNPTINGTLTSSVVTSPSTATVNTLSSDVGTTVSAGSIEGVTLEKLDVSTNASPGDLLVADGTSYVRLAGGANGTYLFADSDSSTGLAWQSASVNLPEIINGASPQSLVVSDSTTPTYTFFAPPSSSSVPRYLRRNPATSAPFLSWQDISGASTFPASPSQTVVVGSLTASTLSNGLFYVKSPSSFTAPSITVNALRALGPSVDESSADTIGTSPSGNVPVRVNNISFLDGSFYVTDSTASPNPAHSYFFQVTGDVGGIFPGRVWQFCCVRLRPGKFRLGGSTFVAGKIALILLDNQSAITSTSPGTTSITLTLPTLPTSFQPFFDASVFPNTGLIPYTSPMSIAPPSTSIWSWPYMKWTSPTSLTLFLPSLQSSNVVNVPTSGFVYQTTYVQ